MIGSTATVGLRSGPRIDVDAPASTPGKMWKCPLDVGPPNRDLPAILAAQTVQECRRRTEDVEPGVCFECTRQALGFPAHLDLGCTVVLVREGADAEAPVRRESQRLAHPDLVVREAEIVVGRGMADRVMVGTVGLQHDLRGLVAAPRTARDLGEQ